MILAPSLPSSLLFATLGPTIALNTTSVNSRPRNGILHLDPLPNPYIVPNTRITLNFKGHYQLLPALDVIRCIQRAQDRFLTHIREYGDGPIPHALNVDYDTAGLRITPLGVPDTLAVLDGIGTKTPQASSPRPEPRFQWVLVLEDMLVCGANSRVLDTPSHGFWAWIGLPGQRIEDCRRPLPQGHDISLHLLIRSCALHVSNTVLPSDVRKQCKLQELLQRIAPW